MMKQDVPSIQDALVAFGMVPDIMDSRKNDGPDAPPRPRCSVYIAISLDGFIAREDGNIEWLSIVQQKEEDYGYSKFFGSVDAVVIGRRTYDTVLGFPSWPYADKRCVVLTHDPPVSQHGESFHAGEPAPLLARLWADGVRRVYVDGGVVIRTFLQATLVDDLTLSFVPVVLGSGIRLFDTGGVEQRLDLVSSQAFRSGLVQVTYEMRRRGSDPRPR